MIVLRSIVLWISYVVVGTLFAAAALLAGLKTGMAFAAPAAAAAGLWLVFLPFRRWAAPTRDELLAVTTVANAAFFACAGTAVVMLPVVMQPQAVAEALELDVSKTRLEVIEGWQFSNFASFLAVASMIAVALGRGFRRFYIAGDKPLPFPPSEGTAACLNAFEGRFANTLGKLYGVVTATAVAIALGFMRFNHMLANRFISPSLTTFAVAAFLPIELCIMILAGAAAFTEASKVLPEGSWDNPTVATGLLVGGALFTFYSKARQVLPKVRLRMGKSNGMAVAFGLVALATVFGTLAKVMIGSRIWCAAILGPLAVALGIIISIGVTGRAGINPANPVSRALLLLVGFICGGPVGILVALVVVEIATQSGAGMLTNLSAARWLGIDVPQTRRRVFWLHLLGTIVAISVALIAAPHFPKLFSDTLPCVSAKTLIKTAEMVGESNGVAGNRQFFFFTATVFGLFLSVAFARYERLSFLAVGIGIGGLIGIPNAVTLALGAIVFFSAKRVLVHRRSDVDPAKMTEPLDDVVSKSESALTVTATGLMTGEAVATVAYWIFA